MQDAADDPEAVQRFAARIAARGRPADPAGSRADRPLPAAGRRTAAGPGTGGRRLGARRGGRPHPHGRPRQGASAIVVGGQSGLRRPRRREPAGDGGDQPAGNAVTYSPGGNRIAVAARARAGVRRDRRDRQRDRHPAQGPQPRVRAVLPGRPVPGQQHRRHRAGPGHRQARRQQPRGLGHGLERGRPRAPRSPCGSRCAEPSAPTRPISADRPSCRRSGHDASAGGRGRGVVLRRAVLHAAARGLRRRRRRAPARRRWPSSTGPAPTSCCST